MFILNQVKQKFPGMQCCSSSQHERDSLRSSLQRGFLSLAGGRVESFQNTVDTHQVMSDISGKLNQTGFSNAIMLAKGEPRLNLSFSFEVTLSLVYSSSLTSPKLDHLAKLIRVPSSCCKTLQTLYGQQLQIVHTCSLQTPLSSVSRTARTSMHVIWAVTKVEGCPFLVSISTLLLLFISTSSFHLRLFLASTDVCANPLLTTRSFFCWWSR